MSDKGRQTQEEQPEETCIYDKGLEQEKNDPDRGEFGGRRVMKSKNSRTRRACSPKAETNRRQAMNAHTHTEWTTQTKETEKRTEKTSSEA